MKRLSSVHAARRRLGDGPARRPLAAIGISLIAVTLAAVPVSAGTVTTRMNDGYDFQPSTRTIARGDTVKWKNTANFQNHDVFATAPSGYFSSGAVGGMDPGDTYSRGFRSAGTYPFICREHSSDGMQGKVKVPMRAARSGGDFRLTVASASAASGYRHDIWVDRPGASGWQRWTYTTAASVTYSPTAGGTYKFKSRLQRLSDGQTSRFSPVASISN